MSDNDDRDAKPGPTVGVLGYGSILAPEELVEFVPEGADRGVPVRVDGFRRAFNQEASWRDVEDEKRAVLNVVRDSDAWFNAVLVPDLTRAEYAEFRERERGYELVVVDSDDVTAYDDADRGIPERLDMVLVSVGAKTDDRIEPIPEYVDICLNGADYWDDEASGFYADFLETTHTTLRLDSYLDRE